MEGEISLLTSDRPKKGRQKKKKGKIEESFPNYLQEAFFGIDLMNSSKYNPVSSRDILNSGSDSDTPQQNSRTTSPSPMPSVTSGQGQGSSLDADIKGLGMDGFGDLGLDRRTPMSTSQPSENDLGEIYIYLVNEWINELDTYTWPNVKLIDPISK